MKKTLTNLISFYQTYLTHLTPVCRYEPSCSQYTKEAIEKYGIKGVWMGVKRFLTCHPCSGRDRWDPVE